MKKGYISVIPAAGLGTRFLPASKAVPKEMFPIVDIPTIELIAREAIASGSKKIIIVISSSKEAILCHHFTYDRSYEEYLIAKGHEDLADKLNQIAKEVEVTFVLQKEQKGLGDAIYACRNVIKNQPFGVLLGDDLMTYDGHKPVLKQLFDAFEKTHSSILGVQEVEASQVSKYGVIDIKEKEDKRLFSLKGMVEKPKLEDAPSRFAALGRYVLTPAIFKALEKTPKGKGGEIQLTDALMLLNEAEPVYAYAFEGKRYDIGDKVGYVEAIIDFALKREDTKEAIKKFLKEKDLK